MDDESHVRIENSQQTDGKQAKRKLEPTVLDNFTKLTNGQQGVRVKAGFNLLKYWLQSTENEENELNYALGRLIRGLGSSKIHARCGFYSTLTALLTLKSDISVDTLLEHVEKQLKKTGSNSKGENADICMGQIELGCSIIRSTLFNRSSDDDKRKVLELLVSAGKERTYMKLAAYSVISELIEKLTEKEFETVVFPSIREELSKPWAEQDIDNLYLMMVIQQKYDGILKSKFLKRFLGTSSLICSESLNHLANILMSIPRVDALKHPFNELFPKIMANTEHLSSFMNELDVYINRPNRNKFLMATKLITNFLEHLEDPDQIPHLLTNNYIIQMLGSFRALHGKQKDPELQQSVHKMFDKLAAKLKPSEISYKIKIGILKKLLFHPGTFIFEKITRSKVVQHITADLDVEGLKKLAKVYRDVVLGNRLKSGEDSMSERWFNNDRLYAAHLLVKLLNHQAVNGDNAWKVEQLKFLMHLGLIKDDQYGNVGSELAASLKETFFRSLDLKHAKLNDLCALLSELVQDLDALVDENNLDVILRSTISAEDYELWKKMTAASKKIETKKKKDNNLALVFHTLFLHMGLQLFNDVKLAGDSLKELFICYERTKKKHMKSEDSEDASDEPLWIEVVTDLFLNLLSHNSHLLRSIINSVVPHLCKYMNAAAIHQILSVLDPKNEDNPLSNKHDESDSENDEEESSKSDGESDESEDDSEDDSQKEDDSEDGGDDDIDDGDGDETVNDKLKLALQQVLQGNGLDDDQGSVDLDYLSENEGEKLNEALAEAFKQFKPNLGRKSKKQSKSDETLTHFRVRVLDLIQIYLDSEPSMILTLEIMLPLLQALEFSIRTDHQKPLEERIRSCLKKLSGLRKFSSVEGVDETVLSELLNSLLEKGTKNALIVQEMGNEISECCVFVIRCSQFLISGEETPKKMKKHLRKTIPPILHSALDTYCKKRDCLIPYVFFKNLIQLNWGGNLVLVPLLTEFAMDDNLRPFRRSQVLELLRMFFQNHRYLNAEKEKAIVTLEETLSKFYTETVTLLENLSENPSDHKIREKVIMNLFSVWTAVKLSPLKPMEFDWKRLGEVIREFRSNVTFSKDCKTAYNKLCSSLGVSNVVKMKPKPIKLGGLQNDDKESVVSSNKDNSVDKKKQKNKSKSREKLKLKKEAKEKRLQSLSEGFGSGDVFSSVDALRSVEEAEREATELNMEVDECGVNGIEEEISVKAKKRKNKNKDSTVSSSERKKKRKTNGLI